MLPERRHDISRLEGFSDALFAFVLTAHWAWGAREGHRRTALETQSRGEPARSA